jgi:hypothetical protein
VGTAVPSSVITRDRPTGRCPADAADIAERLAAPASKAKKRSTSDTVERRRNTRRNAA